MKYYTMQDASCKLNWRFAAGCMCLAYIMLAIENYNRQNTTINVQLSKRTISLLKKLTDD